MVHMQDPSCAPCHAFIDPIGFGLENFDGVGRYRSSTMAFLSIHRGILMTRSSTGQRHWHTRLRTIRITLDALCRRRMPTLPVDMSRERMP